MRTLLNDKGRLPVFILNKENKSFTFNLVDEGVLFRTIRLTIVDSLGLFNDENIGQHLHHFNQFKWEELEVGKIDVIKFTTYKSINEIRDTLCDWMSKMKYIINVIEIELTPNEIKSVWNYILWEINGVKTKEISENVWIIRNEI